MERDVRQLKQMQDMPLDIKLQLTRDRIREWVRAFGVDGVYVSFSGGKDSTVLLHIAREMYPDIPAVFINTGLEYPEIKDFVKTWDNIEWIRPKMGFKDVICKYGYPILSKNISKMFWQAAHGRKVAIEYVNGTANYNGEKSIYCCDRYKAIENMDFTISHMCCDVMKKAPARIYERKNSRKPIVGILAEESQIRTQAWLRHGCNAFESKRQVSMPLSFWTEQDILQYVKQNDIQICKLYGCVTERGGNRYLADSSANIA